MHRVPRDLIALVRGVKAHTAIGITLDAMKVIVTGVSTEVVIRDFESCIKIKKWSQTTAVQIYWADACCRTVLLPNASFAFSQSSDQPISTRSPIR